MGEELSFLTGSRRAEKHPFAAIDDAKETFFSVVRDGDKVEEVDRVVGVLLLDEPCQAPRERESPRTPVTDKRVDPVRTAVAFFRTV